MVSSLPFCFQYGVCWSILQPEVPAYFHAFIAEMRQLSNYFCSASPLQNLILTTQDDITRVKLVDFGLATYLNQKLTTVCGTPQYVAPEVLRSVSGEPYGAECDLWSAGVLLFNLLAGYPPFHSDSVHKVLQQVAHGNIDFRDPVWELISSPAIDLVCGLLTVDRTKRLTVEQALNHPWMAGR